MIHVSNITSIYSAAAGEYPSSQATEHRSGVVSSYLGCGCRPVSRSRTQPFFWWAQLGKMKEMEGKRGRAGLKKRGGWWNNRGVAMATPTEGPLAVEVTSYVKWHLKIKEVFTKRRCEVIFMNNNEISLKYSMCSTVATVRTPTSPVAYKKIINLQFTATPIQLYRNTSICQMNPKLWKGN